MAQAQAVNAAAPGVAMLQPQALAVGPGANVAGQVMHPGFAAAASGRGGAASCGLAGRARAASRGCPGRRAVQH